LCSHCASDWRTRSHASSSRVGRLLALFLEGSLLSVSRSPLGARHVISDRHSLKTEARLGFRYVSRNPPSWLTKVLRRSGSFAESAAMDPSVNVCPNRPFFRHSLERIDPEMTIPHPVNLPRKAQEHYGGLPIWTREIHGREVLLKMS
jgi:hypothetical protein